MRTPIRLIPALLLTAVTSLGAQAAPPGCRTPDFRQFDYWVGEWQVTDSGATKVYGTNSVTNEEAGCLVHEHWASVNGGTGQSLNFYDAAAARWEQVWVGSGGGMLTLIGHLDGGTMVLEGENGPASGRMLNRVAWIPEPDGRVRQLWKVSTDGGKSWTVSFDGWYRRKS